MVEIRKEIIIAGLIIALAILGYGYLNYRQKTEISSMERARKYLREASLQTCLEEAGEAYRKTWNSHCLELGKKEACQLPASVAESYNKYLQEEKDRCVKMWVD